MDNRSTKKACITGDIFGKWLTNSDKQMVRRKLKVPVLLAKCSVHYVDTHMSVVETLFVPSNTTATLQPIDQGLSSTLRSAIGAE